MTVHIRDPHAHEKNTGKKGAVFYHRALCGVWKPSDNGAVWSVNLEPTCPACIAHRDNDAERFRTHAEKSAPIGWQIVEGSNVRRSRS